MLKQDGVILKNNLSLVPLFCNQQNGEIPEGSGFAMLGDAIIQLLTGEASPVHPSNAASTGLYSLAARSWNCGLIEALGLQGLSFPEIYDGKEPVARYTARNGKRIPVYPAVGDHQAAILGVNAKDGGIVINIGTGGQICHLSSDLRFGEYETRPYFNDRHLCVLAQLPSGRSLNVLMDFVAGAQLHADDADAGAIDYGMFWKRVNELAERAHRDAGNTGFDPLSVNLGFFDAAGSECGYIKGINTNNFNVGSLFRSAYAHMAEEYYSAYENHFAQEEHGVSGIVCTGGVIHRTPLLVQMISQRFNIPCAVPASGDDVMNGLMQLALWYTGY